MNIQNVVDNKLCLGCGICSYDKNVSKIIYSKKRGQNIPLLDAKLEYEIANQICPAIGYKIVSEGKRLYPDVKYSLELGRFLEHYAGHSVDNTVLSKASSGGLITEFLLYILAHGIVDKVAVTKFIYTENGPLTKTFLTSDIDAILESQGSKYCPVDISEFIREIESVNCKIAYVGTPCNIAGIRNIQRIDSRINDNIVLTISNFCGGFKSFNQVRKIALRHDIDYAKISFLRYRGGGQPGSMLLKDNKGGIFTASYKKYGGFTGYNKHLRCHLCVDATGELADISFGDAWLEKYKNSEYPWSVILIRTVHALNIINAMKNENRIVLEEITINEVCLSQRQNINSKKYRQFTRFKLYKFLGYLLPSFDGGYKLEKTPMYTEVKVFFIHKTKECLEKIGLYRLFRYIIRKDI